MRNVVFYSLLAVSLFAVAFICGCASYGGGTTTTTMTGTTVQGQYSIEIKNFAFNINPMTVPVGTTVTWTNFDAAPHTVTPDTAGNPPGFGSGSLSTGQSYSFTFNQAGTYPYHCSIHPYMTASIIVQ